MDDSPSSKLTKVTGIRDVEAPSNDVLFFKARIYSIGAAWIGINILVWGLALVYVASKPETYVSEWVIALPGAEATTNVELPGIGRAYSQGASPYTLMSDPREDYKFLAQTEEVIEMAANQMGMPPDTFESPKIEIVPNTTLMRFQIESNEPRKAQEKAFALQRSLEQRLQELRQQESRNQEYLLRDQLDRAENQLKLAQEKVSSYKSTFGLINQSQIGNLSNNLEQLRRQRSEMIAEMNRAGAQSDQLIVDLGLGPTEASEMFKLQADPLFQEYFNNYSQASGDLNALLGRFTPASPSVITRQLERDEALTELLSRGQSLLGKPVSLEYLDRINPSVSSSGSSAQRDQLFQELILINSRYQGLISQVKSLTEEIQQLEGRFAQLSTLEPNLNNLERDVQIAEALFSSTLTRLELNRSNAASTYPSIALIAGPNLPKNSSQSTKLLAIAGAFMFTLFTASGTILLLMIRYHLSSRVR